MTKFRSVALAFAAGATALSLTACANNSATPAPASTAAAGGAEIALITPGKLTERQYDDAVADLVAYLQWMGEPAQAQRFQLGVIVLIFLLFLTVFAWRLNATYWKDVK